MKTNKGTGAEAPHVALSPLSPFHSHHLVFSFFFFFSTRVDVMASHLNAHAIQGEIQLFATLAPG